MTLNRRLFPAALLAASLGQAVAAPPKQAARTKPLSSPLPDTGQTRIFSDRGQMLAAPGPTEAFYGQDGQFEGRRPAYAVSKDGKVVRDLVTGLMWQRSPELNNDGALTAADKLTYEAACKRPAALNAERHGGYTDWRLPTIKELYSLIDFRGVDPSPMAAATGGLIPFIDTKAFAFAYGRQEDGERVIDSQYASSTLYVAQTNPVGRLLFGVNFADGRIKGYGLTMPGGRTKTFYVQCVRGPRGYGINQLKPAGQGLVQDQATGLMWEQGDSGKGMTWQQALALAHERNRSKHLGYSDWRLPNAKELQSIVDYGRSPDTTRSAAISPLFRCTAITNEAGQTDYPFYWTSTTHGEGRGDAAVYVAFGRSLGNMGQWIDIHGAGSQRSDPKSGDPSVFAAGRGPQGDAIHILNYVRLVRDVQPGMTRAAKPSLAP
ncbi:MAG: DUF1566 domain-containing protein, partial [Armatimonadetes bacterium]|nr:DUF1566 domain-containing protein [Armatimonadota bacterium]